MSCSGIAYFELSCMFLWSSWPLLKAGYSKSGALVFLIQLESTEKKLPKTSLEQFWMKLFKVFFDFSFFSKFFWHERVLSLLLTVYMNSSFTLLNSISQGHIFKKSLWTWFYLFLKCFRNCMCSLRFLKSDALFKFLIFFGDLIILLMSNL